MNKSNDKSIILGIISVLFIVIVLYIYFNRTLGSIYDVSALDTSNKLVTYNPNITSNGCNYFVDRPTIILRYDDIGAHSIQAKPLINELLVRNMSATLGVVPAGLEKDKELMSYLQSLDKNKIEIAQHGVYHDFGDSNLTSSDLIAGKSKIERLTGSTPTTYIPPFNVVNSDLLNQATGNYHVISGEGTVFKEGNILQIGGGYDIKADLFEDNSSIPNNDKIIYLCDAQLRAFNVCVLTFNPREYSSNPQANEDLNITKFQQYRQLLNGINRLNATTRTFNDISYCSYDNSTLR
jgi:hypothetical protein